MALIDNVEAFWELEEAGGSATRNDAHGANHLTDVNTVGQAAGVIGSTFSAQFTSASSERLTIADNPSLSMGNIDLTIACWVYLDTKPANQMYFVSKWNSTGADREYQLAWDNTIDRFKFTVSSNGTSGVAVQADVLGAPSTATWYFIVAEHNATTDLITIAVNNGTANTTAHTTGIRAGASTFGLGALILASPTNFLNGRMDQVIIKKGLWTATEKTWIYNSGAARTYAQVLAGMPTFIPAWAARSNVVIQPGGAIAP